MGYQSYLAHTSDKTFFHAQKVAGKWFGLFALIQLALGLAIHYLLDWDQYVIVWLLTFYFFILIPLTLTEHELYQYLDRRHELPANYVKPDDRPLIRTKGLKDRLK